MGLAAEIYEFVKLLLSIVFNNYVIWYLVLPGIIAAAIIKLKKQENKPYFKSILKFLIIYYVARTIVVIFFY
jgi:hypothetical protein